MKKKKKGAQAGSAVWVCDLGRESTNGRLFLVFTNGRKQLTINTINFRGNFVIYICYLKMFLNFVNFFY